MTYRVTYTHWTPDNPDNPIPTDRLRAAAAVAAAASAQREREWQEGRCPVAGPDRERCWLDKGHEGLHDWQVCTSGEPGGCGECGGYSCELPAGHDGPHTYTWED